MTAMSKTPRKRTPPPKRTPPSAFRLGTDLTDAMAALQERDGIPPSETVRRALRMFLEAKGVMPAPATRLKKGGR